MTPHQRRLTAAREAVVEAAKELVMRADKLDDDETGTLDDIKYNEAWDAMRAAVAALRAIEQETSNG